MMSGDSERITIPKEDKAYCIMGFFDVNMRLFYGEGQKAFLRLQLKIIKSSNDESIFTWTATAIKLSSMLASSAKYFATSGDFVRYTALARPS